MTIFAYLLSSVARIDLIADAMYTWLVIDNACESDVINVENSHQSRLLHARGYGNIS